MSEDKYKWRKSVILTKKEGAILESIVAQNGCGNVSQFIKRLVHNGYNAAQQNAIGVYELSDEENHFVAEALAKTNSASIIELCRKISDGQIAIIIR